MMETSADVLTTFPVPVQQALREFQKAIQRLYGRYSPSLVLYGSYARGEAGVDSDVDLLLIYPRKVKPGDEIQRLKTTLAELNLRYEVLISILPASRSDYRHSPGPFWHNIRQEGVLIG